MEEEQDDDLRQNTARLPTRKYAVDEQPLTDWTAARLPASCDGCDAELIGSIALAPSNTLEIPGTR